MEELELWAFQELTPPDHLLRPSPF